MIPGPTSTLSERYVREVSRRIPDRSRSEVVAQLRAAIAHKIEQRLKDGSAGRDVAEYQIISELGDPAITALRYRDQPLHLIGPEYFPAYLNSLRTLIPLVPVVVAVAAVINAVAEHKAVVVALGDAAGNAVQVVINVGFWVTLVFAIIERKGGKAPFGKDWTPDKLPDSATTARNGIGKFIGGVAGALLIALFLVWQRSQSPLLDDAGNHVPLFHPGLWSGWIIAIFACLLAFVGVEFAKFRVGRWTYPLAWANGLANAAFVGVLAGLTLTDRLINPVFVSTMRSIIPDADGANVVTWLASNLWVLIAIAVVINTSQAFMKARDADQ